MPMSIIWAKKNFTRPFFSGLGLASSALSYIVGVLLVLAITIVAVGVYSLAVSYQGNVFSGFLALDLVRSGESLVVVHYQPSTGELVLYNNGRVATCFVEVIASGIGTVYSDPACTPIPPLSLYSITLSPAPPAKTVIIARTTTNKILTYTVG